MRISEVRVGRYPPAVIVNAQDSALKVLRGLASEWVRHAVLVDERELLAGMVSARDVVSFLGGGAHYSIVEEEYEGDLYKALREVSASRLSYAAPYVSLSDDFARVIEVMLEKGVGAIAVVDESGKPVGVVSERHIVSLFADVTTNVSVSEVMTAPLLSARPSDPLVNAMRLMISRHIRRVPLLEGKEIAGILTIKDVVTFFASASTQARLAKEGVERVWSTPLSRLGSKTVVTVPARVDVGDALRVMRDKGVGSLVVVDDAGRPLGIFTERDVITKVVKLKGVEVFVDEIERVIVAARVVH